MSDVTEAATQDEIANSLLPAEEQQIEQAVTEQPAESEAEPQPQEQEQQEVQQEEVENWLPTEQDKIFPDEVLSRYAERYGINEQALADPQLKQLLIDKINSDIFIQQQQQFTEQQPEPEAQRVEPTQTQPQVTREQYFQNLDRVIAERTDPEVAKSFHREFIAAWQRPEAEQAMAVTQVMSKYALNLVSTFLPDMLQAQLSQQIGQAFPGFDDMYDRSAHAMAWDRVRNSDPQFAQLPAYGTKEFSKTLRAAAARYPGFDNIQFTDEQGKPLGKMENAMQKYAMLAQAASGQNVNPQLLQQAAAAGARNARRAEVRRSAGNLGSGQSKGGSQQTRSNSQFQSNQDIFDDDTMDMWHREHGRL